MKTRISDALRSVSSALVRPWLILVTCTSLPIASYAQNSVCTYQGRVTANGTNFNGTGLFKFAIVTATDVRRQATATATLSGGFLTIVTVNDGGAGYFTAPSATAVGGGGSGAVLTAHVSGGAVTSISVSQPGSGYTSTPTIIIGPPSPSFSYVSYWSNDGTSASGNEPASAVTVPVNNGLFSIGLGDTNIASMQALPASVFLENNLKLRIWFNDGVAGSTVLDPPQPLTATPYAARASMADTSANLTGTLSAGQLAGTIANSNLPLNATFSGTVTAAAFSGNGAGLSNVTAISFSGNGAGLTNVNASTFNSLGPDAFWQLGGNNVGGGQFIGSLNNQAVTIAVNSQSALQIAPSDNGPNIVGAPANGNSIDATSGSSFLGAGANNSIQSNSVYAVLGGGFGNTIQPAAYSSFLGGGQNNSIQLNSAWNVLGGGSGNIVQSNAYFNFLGGGAGNSLFASASVLGGGNGNAIQGDATSSFLGGGTGNGIQVNADHSFLGGGSGNTVGVNGSFSFLGGGAANNIQSNCSFCFLGGGTNNSIQSNTTFAVIGGGQGNAVQSNANSVICGGQGNTIQQSSSQSFIGGGILNVIQPGADRSFIGGGSANYINNSAFLSTIGGGLNNSIGFRSDECAVVGGSGNSIFPASRYAFIGGGFGNAVNGAYGTVPGGSSNLATNQSFAAGTGAQAIHTGAFVWSDSSAGTSSTANNSVTMRASGGFTFYTTSGNAGASLGAGGTSWGVISDREAKKNFAPIDSQAVLDKLATISVQSWNYKWEQDSDIPHIGPVAQDFKQAFYPGRDDKTITTLEFDGVELAAIQGLNKKLETKDAEIQELKRALSELRRRLERFADSERTPGLRPQ